MNIPFAMPDIDPKAHQIITCTIEGILEEDDVRALLMQRSDAGEDATPSPAAPEPENPRDLKRIKEKHHSVARLIAGGLPQRMVASLSGYNEQYLSVLLNNPSMVELVSLYRIQYGKSAEIITERLRTVGTQALERLEERIPSMGDNELIQTAKLGLDRAGHGPTTTQHSITESHLFDHADLARMNAEARKGSASYIVDVEEVRKALPSPQPGTDDEEEPTP